MKLNVITFSRQPCSSLQFINSSFHLYFNVFKLIVIDFDYMISILITNKSKATYKLSRWFRTWKKFYLEIHMHWNIFIFGISSDSFRNSRRLPRALNIIHWKFDTRGEIVSIKLELERGQSDVPRANFVSRISMTLCRPSLDITKIFSISICGRYFVAYLLKIKSAGAWDIWF